MATGTNQLTSLINRLEQATKRLEDIASSTAPETPQANGASEPPSKASSINGESALSPSLAPRSATTAAAVSNQPETPKANSNDPPSLQAFDSLVRDELQDFSDISDRLGGVIAEQARAFCTAFKSQRKVLLVATMAKEPSQSEPVYMEVVKDLTEGIQTVNDFRDKNRKTPEENHLAMLADGTGILVWVTVKPSPDKYVSDVLDGAQFFGNKILVEFKNQDTEDKEWVRTFVKLCGSLVQYIKQHHAKGLQWNSGGMGAEEALRVVREGDSAPPATSTNGASASGEAAAPPPPPPPPPLPQLDVSPATPRSVEGRSADGGKGASDMSAVFDQLNRGESVTSGLRKVDKSEMTHKNPALRAEGPTPERSDSQSSSGRGKSPTPPLKKQKPESLRSKKPSRKELDGNKWIVENFEGEKAPIEIEAEKQQSILITRCKGVTVRVNGKANAVSIDNCSKVAVLVDSLVSTMDVISSSNFQMQVLGTLSSVQLDKVDVGTVFLSEDSVGAEILTSKCTSINVTLPPASEQADSVECPVPEQIRSKVIGGKLVSEIVKQEG